MSDNLTLVVPTRDGAPHAFILAEAYRDCGLDVLHAIDGRSSRAYRDAAFLHFDRRRIVRPWRKGDFIEAILPSMARGIRTEWAFRFDDDEFPSASLREWLPVAAASTERASIAAPRRGIAMIDGEPMMARSIPHLLPRDDQYRGFRVREARYRSDLHSPGVILDQSEALHAPDSCWLFHFDWIVRDRNERAAKLARYEIIRPGCRPLFEHQYLFEDFDPALYDFVPVEDPFIAKLARRLDLARRSDAASPAMAGANGSTRMGWRRMFSR